MTDTKTTETIITLDDLKRVIQIIPEDISDEVNPLHVRVKLNPEVVPDTLKAAVQALFDYHETMVMAAKNVEILRNPKTILGDVSFGVKSIQEQILKARDFCRILFPLVGRDLKDVDRICLGTLGTTQQELDEFCIEGYLAEEISWRDSYFSNITMAHDALHKAQALGYPVPCPSGEEQFCTQARILSR